MNRARVWLITSALIFGNLGLGAIVAFLVGWFFDSLAAALILFALWAIVSAPFAWRAYAALQRASQILVDVEEQLHQAGDLYKEKNPQREEFIDIDKMNHDEWNRQLAGIVDELGIDNPDIQVCVYPEHTYDTNATPLFTARPNDLLATLSRLRADFGGGHFWVIIFVKGVIRRRFTLFVEG